MSQSSSRAPKTSASELASSEQSTTGGRIVAAINPSSGAGKGKRRAELVLRHLADALTGAGLGLEVLPIQAADAAELTQLLATTLCTDDVLVAVGGDGMVNLCANAAITAGVPLGILPTGTGNDIADQLGISHAADQASRQLASALGSGARTSLDSILVEQAAGQRYFLGAMALGFDAVVNERANRWHWPRGSSRYVLATLRELPVFRPRSYRLQLDEHSWQQDAVLVVAGNLGQYGGGMQVLPQANGTDGLMDVMVVRGVSRWRLLRIFPRVFSGAHVHEPEVTMMTGHTLQVDSPNLVAYADGERFGSLPATLRVCAGSIQILVGESSPAGTTLEP